MTAMLKTGSKLQLQDLAIFGQPPAFAEKMHVGRPNVGNREHLLARINDMLDRNWFTNNGPYVQEFETKLAAFVGVRHCVAMCNGTVALEIAIRALGLTGEVIVPSFTFIATAHALQWQEITPVFCDIDPRTHNLDPGQVEKMITPRTSGIIGVHTWGRSCDIDCFGSHRPRPQPAATFRRGPRLRLLLQGQIDRRLRTLRGLQLPRHQVLQYL